MINDITDFNHFIQSKLDKGVYSSVFYNQLIQIQSGPPLILGGTDFSEFRLFHILDTISYLEKGMPKSFTKKEKRFSGVLKNYYHKHIYNVRSLSYLFDRDLADDKEINTAIRKTIDRLHNRVKKTFRDLFVYCFVFDREHQLFEKRKITGEWIVYYKGSTRNIYLTVASHNECYTDILSRIKSTKNEFREEI